MLRRVVNASAMRVALPAAGRFASIFQTGATQVVDAVSAKGIFDKSAISAAAEKLKNIGFDSTNGQCFSVSECSEHLYGFLCAQAKKAIGDAFGYSHEGATSAFYYSEADHKSQIAVLHQIEKFVTDRSLSQTHATSVRSYTSDSENVALFCVSLDPFLNPNAAPLESDLTKLTTSSFLETKSTNVQKRYQSLIAQVHTATKPTYKVESFGGDGFVVSMCFVSDRTSYFKALNALINEIPNVKVSKKFMETFSNGAHVYSFYVSGITAEELERRTNMVGLLPNRPTNPVTALHENQVFTAEQTIFAHCLIIFSFYFTPPPTDEDYLAIRSMVQTEPQGLHHLNSLRTTLAREMSSERYTGILISAYSGLVKEIFNDFVKGTTKASRAVLRSKIKDVCAEDNRTKFERDILMTFVNFNKYVIKHNFFKTNKAAIGFRLDPEFISRLDFPRVPHGVFMFVGAQWRGFHVRFTDIARGGVRMIISKTRDYKNNKKTLFRENFNLAHTQLLKNKDIPEGGSKGTIFVNSEYLTSFEESKCKTLFLQYVDALLDLIIPNQPGVVDNYNQTEIIFLGPDENTAGTFPKAGALFSRDRGYSAWKSFTTGKDPDLGGIPHDTYGMTTRSVRQNVEGVYRKLKLDETKLTKFMTGGPDGDLGSNEILRSNEIYVGVADISASLHDPKGIDREELRRLAKKRVKLEEFDTSKLSPEGFLVKAKDKNIKLPDGTFVDDGTTFRNTFHFSKYVDADVFVPCGGRPASVDLSNVHLFVNGVTTGEKMLSGQFDKAQISPHLKFKYIIEGANLFLTQEARLALEKCGVIVIKDMVANKGGVTSSSLEVLAGLSLSDEEHKAMMSAKSKDDAPQFYKSYVEEICTRVEENARREFEAIWKVREQFPDRPITEIADALSLKIVLIRQHILKSNLLEDSRFLRYVMRNYTPKTLLDVVPLQNVMDRVPQNYQHAICAMWIASEYAYTCGPYGSEINFFEFMREHFEKSRSTR